jgi:hypothetical protein
MDIPWIFPGCSLSEDTKRHEYHIRKVSEVEEASECSLNVP